MKVLPSGQIDLKCVNGVTLIGEGFTWVGRVRRGEKTRKIFVFPVRSKGSKSFTFPFLSFYIKQNVQHGALFDYDSVFFFKRLFWCDFK